MTLETLQKEMIAAMKNKDKIRKDTISSLIGAIKKVAIDEKCKDNIAEDLVNRVLLKEKKTMQEMIDTCPADRTETLEEYNQKMAIINEFTPKMMTEDEIYSFVEAEVIELTSVNVQISPKIKGMLMKNIMPKLKGKADGKLINKVVTDIIDRK